VVKCEVDVVFARPFMVRVEHQLDVEFRRGGFWAAMDPLNHALEELYC
jgi:hypothetical protein